MKNFRHIIHLNIIILATVLYIGPVGNHLRAEDAGDAIVADTDNKVRLAMELMQEANTALQRGINQDTLHLARSLYIKAGKKFEEATGIYKGLEQNQANREAALGCENAAKNCYATIQQLNQKIYELQVSQGRRSEGPSRFDEDIPFEGGQGEVVLVEKFKDLKHDAVIFKDGSHLTGQIKKDKDGVWVDGTFIPEDLIAHIYQDGSLREFGASAESQPADEKKSGK